MSTNFGEEHDWDIDANGFYSAIRGSLNRIAAQVKKLARS